jgi:Rps23 Pro-64 3,4-dihydroxylase Tpa1-like proline 4-hydroxylase
MHSIQTDIFDSSVENKNEMEENVTECKLEIRNNFLNSELYDECIQFSKKIFTEQHTRINDNFRINLLAWESDIINDSNPIYIYDLYYLFKESCNYDLYNKLFTFIKNNIGVNIKNLMFYFYTPGSHIPFHSDYPHNGSITIYLNEVWDKNNGGYFLFEYEDEIKTIIPEKNKIIIQYGNIPHSVSCTTKDSKIRRTIQCFF